MIAEAELIVEGKVVEVTSRWSENRTTIYTDVTLGDLNVVHGEVARDTLTLRFEGGEIDGFRVEVLGAPSFDLGERELLFVRANNVAVSPVVGVYQGRFKVIDGEIHDNDGLPIVEIRGDTFVKVASQPEQLTSAEMTAGIPDNRRYSYREGAEEKPTEAPKEVLPPQASEGSKEPDTAEAAAEAGRVAPPPQPTEEQVPLTPQEEALPSTLEQVVVYVEPRRDTGKRLSAEEFIRIIRARLNP
jgi:hypothetical protein